MMDIEEYRKRKRFLQRVLIGYDRLVPTFMDLHDKWIDNKEVLDKVLGIYEPLLNKKVKFLLTTELNCDEIKAFAKEIEDARRVLEDFKNGN